MNITKKHCKIVMFNAVLTNNGDAALTFSLVNLFDTDSFDTKIASNYFETVKKIYCSNPIVRNLGDFKWLRKVPFRKFIEILILPFFYFFSKAFRECDLLIACPGGYLNSYYGFRKVALTLIIAKKLRKRTAIYSQSVGPLNKRGERLLKRMFKYVDLIYVRDMVSLNNLKKIGLTESGKCRLTVDTAFLLSFSESPSSVGSNVIAVSVRSWKYDNRDLEKYSDLIGHLVKSIVGRGFEVEFISTCQGLKNYIDDSKTAEFIVSRLDDSVKQKVIVNNKYYRLNEFKEYLSKFHAVVGTRLHFCILAMLAGIPAFNISYEIKGKEVYRYCNLTKYSIDYNEDIAEGKNHLDFFLDNLPSIRALLPQILKKCNERAQDDFSYFLSFFDLK